MAEKIIGVIGGSGLYEMEALTDIEEIGMETPFGDPSDAFITGRLNGVKMVFLPRHGRGHRYSPSVINYRANMWGMKKLGVTHILSVSACGSMKEEIKPGQIVFIDQFIDRTRQRKSTFFTNGVVGHIAFADPICKDVRQHAIDAAVELGVEHHVDGTYLCMEGPAFSTRAESHLYRGWGVTVIGMTNLTEAKLAREAEICYTTISLVTDYDCWRTSEADVDINEILETMRKNAANAKNIIAKAAQTIPEKRECKCATAAKFAMMTDPNVIPEQTKKDLDILYGRYWKE